MRIKKNITLFLFVVLGYAYGIHAQTATDLVTHVVVDGFTARPIEGARVFYAWEENGALHHHETRSDSDGHAHTSFPKDATVRRIGISASRYTPRSFSPTNTHYTHEITPTRTYTVRGMVRNTKGMPVADAHVFLVPDDAEWQESLRGCDAWSDADGGFTLHGVPYTAGPHSLYAVAPLYLGVDDNRYRVVPGHGDVFLSVQLTAGTKTRGRVTRQNGAALAGVRVWAREITPDEHAAQSYRNTVVAFTPLPGGVTYSDEEGYFVVSNIPPYMYVALHADHPEFQPAVLAPLSARTIETDSLQFVLREPVSGNFLQAQLDQMVRMGPLRYHWHTTPLFYKLLIRLVLILLQAVALWCMIGIFDDRIGFLRIVLLLLCMRILLYIPIAGWIIAPVAFLFYIMRWTAMGFAKTIIVVFFSAVFYVMIFIALFAFFYHPYL